MKCTLINGASGLIGSRLIKRFNKNEIKINLKKKINISWVFYATPEMRIHYQRLFGAPYRIRTCDPRFRKPMLYPTELRAQLIYSRYLSQNMSICFLNPIYISRNLSVKRQMSDTRKSGITICNSNDSFFHVKYLVAIDSESQRLERLRNGLQPLLRRILANVTAYGCAV